MSRQTIVGSTRGHFYLLRLQMMTTDWRSYSRAPLEVHQKNNGLRISHHLEPPSQRVDCVTNMKEYNTGRSLSFETHMTASPPGCTVNFMTETISPLGLPDSTKKIKTERPRIQKCQEKRFGEIATAKDILRWEVCTPRYHMAQGWEDTLVVHKRGSRALPNPHHVK